MSSYTTLSDVKLRLGIADDDQTDDVTLEAILEAASRAIDNYCGRRFYADTTDTTRYFTAAWSDLLWPGDLVSITTLATDADGDGVYECVWDTSDYVLEPPNADLDGRPYTAIRVTPCGHYAFPLVIPRGVRIIGKWGWPEIPPAVQEACCLLAARLFRRRDAIFGIVGSPELGMLRQVLRLDNDPELQLLLAPYVTCDLLGV